MSINTKAYIEEYLHIKTKDSKTIPLKLNEPQLKLYESIKRQHQQGKPIRVIILKARQMGFSTLTEAIIFKKTATARNVNSGIVAHDKDATTNLFNMSKLYYDKLPEALKPQIQASNAKEIIFDGDNGLKSIIKCYTAGNQNGIGRSSTFHNLHISEYAFWPGNKNETLNGLMQAVPNTPNSMVVIESTANGFDDFKSQWDDACNGNSDFEPIFCAWWELEEYSMPYTGFKLTPEEEELKKLYNLTNEQLTWRRWVVKNNCSGDINKFKQEYPSNPHEAFIMSGQSVFDNEIIIKRLAKIPKPIKQGYFLHDTTYNEKGEVISNIRWEDDANGYIKIYKEPKEKRPYVISGDTAGEGSDFNTAQVLDNTTGEQVASLQAQISEDIYARQIYCLGKYYNTALIGIEANFSTYPIRTLQELNYPKQYVRETFDNYTQKHKKSFGFRTTSATRPVIIAELVKIARENPELINDEATLKEMLVFIKNERGRPEAMQGEHDDLVMALAIAYHIRPQQRMTVETEQPKVKWHKDQYEDYNNADSETKAYLINKWGNPF